MQHNTYFCQSNHNVAPPPPPGGGGGSLPLEVVPDARESPSKKHPKRGFNGIPKDTLNMSHGPISILNKDDCHVYIYQNRPY